MDYTDNDNKMREAFKLYLEKCTDIKPDATPYYDIEPIDQCLSSESFIPVSMLHYDDPKEWADKMSVLEENSAFQDLVEEEARYQDVIQKYHDFLVARIFAMNYTGKGESVTANADRGVDKNIIYFGAPGTGKSHTIETKYPDKTEDNTTLTTFHPASDYATFVGCYKPTKDETGELTYEFVAQPFIEAYINAWLLPDYKNYYLVIEEINRGNCAQVFGDIFQLLDRELNGLSTYKVTPDHDLQNYLHDTFAKVLSEHPDHQEIPEYILSGRKMQLPVNLWILATMNTSDQSLFPMDSAFKRRWGWRYIPIKDEGKSIYIEINGNKYDWADFLQQVNEKIAKLTQSEDKQLGYWFVKVGNDKRITADTFVNKVLFYLWSDVFKDYANDASSPFTQKIAKDVSKQTFRSFIRNNGKLNFEEINRFLQHGVGVAPLSDEEDGEEPTEIGRPDRTRGKKQYLKVTYSDGHVYNDNNATQVFKSVIEEADIERVRDLGIVKSGSPLIARTLEEIPDKARYRDVARNHQLSTGDYLFTTMSNKDKQDILNYIKDQLGLNYTAEIYTKDEDSD